MLESIASWLVKLLLDWLLKKSVSAVQEHQAEVEKEKQQGITNEANVKKYEAAQTRVEKVKASIDLLNRNRT